MHTCGRAVEGRVESLIDGFSNISHGRAAPG